MLIALYRDFMQSTLVLPFIGTILGVKRKG
jgi:hypothetical protein